jgi:hypothetical protein
MVESLVDLIVHGPSCFFRALVCERKPNIRARQQKRHECRSGLELLALLAKEKRTFTTEEHHHHSSSLTTHHATMCL